MSRVSTRDLRPSRIRMVTDSEGVGRLIVEREPDPGLIAFIVISTQRSQS